MTPNIVDVAEVLEDTQKGKYLTFAIGNEDYGIEISYVTEIIGIQEITNVPELPDYLVPPPDVKTGFYNRYIKGIGKIDGEVKLILDCEKILTEEEMDQL